MTPSDVCRFELTKGADGHAYLSSTDDSILSDRSKAVFASQCGQAANAGEYCEKDANGNLTGRMYTKVLDWAIRTNSAGTPVDMNEIGHIEVLGAWGAQGTIVHPAAADASYPAGSVVIKEAMSKADLFKIMGTKMNRASLALVPAQNEALTYATGRMVGGVCTATPDMDNADGAVCNVAAGVVPSSLIRSTDPSWIQLAGEVQLDSATDRMGVRMTALDGDVWNNLESAAHVPAYGLYSYSMTPIVTNGYAFDGRTVSNPTFDFTFGAYLELGASLGGARASVGSVATYDNIVEIENALAASQLKGAYENKNGDLTNLIVTFPTKYRHDSSNNFYRENIAPNSPSGPMSLGDTNDNRDVCASEMTLVGGHSTGDARLYDNRSFYPPFRPEGSIQYGMTVWDDQEHRVTQTTVNPIFSPLPQFTPTLQTMTDEVNYMWVTWPSSSTYDYSSGWFNLGLIATPGCQYAGAPVLAYAHKTQSKANGFVNSWLMPLTTD
jgi:hypothetical protein